MLCRTRSALAAALIALSPLSAAAQIELGIDLDLVSPQDDRLYDNVFYGVGLRGGYLLPNPGLDIVPELQLSYAALGGSENVRGPGFELHAARVLAGARVGLPVLVLRPGAYGHVGIGWLDAGVTSTQGMSRTSATAIRDENALAWDAGILLDVVLIPSVDLGIHAGYNAIQIAEPVQWLNAGLHASFGF